MKQKKNWFSVLPSLVIPLCLGLSLYLGLLALIDREVIADETVMRYLMGHPVSRISLALFLIGLSSLAMIGLDVFKQFAVEKKITLAGVPREELDSDAKSLDDSSVQDQGEDHQPLSDWVADQASACSEELMALPTRYREHYLWQRIASALQSIYRTGSASKVEEELKYLADLDREKQQQRYSLVQILIWATPMLGFLGTVLGISQALGGIAVGPDNDFQQMMDGLKGSLYVAFDTTALALTLSMFLMFGQFLVDRFESQLLQLVDHRSHNEITSQFDLTMADEEGGLFSQKLETELVAAMQSGTEKQVELWQQSIQTAGNIWSESVAKSHYQLDQDLTEAIDYSVSRLARSLEEAIDRADHSMSHRWEQWQVMLSENARQLAKQQGELASCTKSLSDLICDFDAKLNAQLAAASELEINAKTVTQQWSQHQSLNSFPIQQIATREKRLQQAPNAQASQPQPKSLNDTPTPTHLDTPSTDSKKSAGATFKQTFASQQTTIETKLSIPQEQEPFSVTGISVRSLPLDQLRSNSTNQQVILPLPIGNPTQTTDSANSTTHPRTAKTDADADDNGQPVIVPFIRKAA